jgi:hypothetical protein
MADSDRLILEYQGKVYGGKVEGGEGVDGE